MITREVSIVFHVAATVRFDEKMKLAVPINVRSPKDVTELCKEMPSLKASEMLISVRWKAQDRVITARFYSRSCTCQRRTPIARTNSSKRRYTTRRWMRTSWSH